MRRYLKKKGDVGLYLLRALALPLAFCVDILVVRALGAAEYDLLAIGLSWLASLSLFAGMGINTAMSRHVPEYQATGHYSRAKGYIRWSQTTMGTVGAATGCVFFLLSTLVFKTSPRLAPVIGFVSILVPIQALNLHRQAALQSFHKPAHSIIPDQIIRPFVVALLTGAILLVGRQTSAIELCWVYMFAIVLAYVVGDAFKKRHTPDLVRNSREEFLPRKWWSTARALLTANVCGVIFYRIDPAMLGAIGPQGEAGLYSIGNRVAGLTLFWIAASNIIISPKISALYTTNRKTDLQALLTTTVKAVSLFAALSTTLLLLFSEEVVRLFGADMGSALRPMQVLLVSYCICTFFGAPEFLLPMTGHHRICAIVLALFAALKLLGNYLLIPDMGAYGAALSTGATLVSAKAALWLVSLKRTGLDSSILAQIRTI